MTDNSTANTLGDLGRLIQQLMNWGVYVLLAGMYQVFFNVASAQLFESETIKNFYGRVQLIIGVFMVFKLAVSILQGIMDPDKFMNPKEGFGNFITRVVVALALLTVIVPINIPDVENANSFEKYLNNNGLLFGTLYSLQDRILSNNTLGRLILGTTDNATNTESPDTTGMTEAEIQQQKLTRSSRIFTSTILKAFLKINLLPPEVRENDDETNKENWYCGSNLDDDGKNAIKSYQQLDVDPTTLLSMEVLTADCKVNDSIFDHLRNAVSWIPILGGFVENTRYVFAFNWLASAIVGIVFLIILIGFTIDIAVRSIKLAVLRLLAPIPIISYIEPKSSKDGGMFSSWVKALTSTYLDLFLRLAIVYFVIFLIQDMIANGIIINETGGLVGGFSIIFIMLGLFFFAKMAPKFIKDALGLKGSMSNIGLSGILGAAGAIRQGGSPMDAVFAAGDAANAQVQSYNQGKPAPSVGMAFNSGRDLAAQMMTGDDRMNHQKMARGKWQLREMGITPQAAKRVHDASIQANAFTERMSSDAMNHRFTYDEYDPTTGARVTKNYKYKDQSGVLHDVQNEEDMSLALAQQRALSGKLAARDKKLDAEMHRTGQARGYRDSIRKSNENSTSSWNQAITDKYLAYRQGRPHSSEKGVDTYQGPMAANPNDFSGFATGYDVKTHQE